MSTEAWQQRVIDELAELEDRREKLSIFRMGDLFRSLDPKDQALLWTQGALMADYALILKMRIARFSEGCV